MAVLETLVGRIVENGVYPYDIIDSITIDRNRRGTILRFTPESVRILPLKLTFVSDEIDQDNICRAIKTKITPNEKAKVKLVKLKDVGKSNG